MFEFLKTATAMRKTKTKMKVSFLDFDEHDIAWKEIYNEAVQLASWMIRRKWTTAPTALIGRLNRFSSKSFVSSICNYQTCAAD